MKFFTSLAPLALVFWSALLAPAQAQFAAAVSPPRFELELQSGQTLRQVIEIAQAGDASGNYRFATADWSLGEDGEVSFHDALQPGSCRPWVAIERRSAVIAPQVRLRYRFEITPPADAPPQECRFAIMIQGEAQPAQMGGAMLSVSGRVAVVVYARLGGVQPQLQVEQTLSIRRDGLELPALRVHNAGTATGRLAGLLTGRDAGGTALELAPESLPLLPGMRRTIALLPLPPLDKPDTPPPAVERWPLVVRGTIEVEGRQPVARVPIDATFARP